MNQNDFDRDFGYVSFKALDKEYKLLKKYREEARHLKDKFNAPQPKPSKPKKKKSPKP